MDAVGTQRSRWVLPSRTLLPWIIGTVSLAGFVTAWILAIAFHDVFDVAADYGPDRFLIVYAVIGAVLAVRRPANRIGWLLLAVGLVVAARAVAGEYARHALAGASHPAAAVGAAWFLNWSLVLVFPAGLLLFLLLLFPDGRPPTPRWAALGWVAGGLTTAYIVLTSFDPGVIQVAGLPALPNPTGVRWWPHMGPSSPVANGAWFAGLAVLVLGVASLVLRYRRSAGDERLQLKWFVYAAVVSLVLLAALQPVSEAGTRGHMVYDLAVVAGFGLALPASIGVVVLKYRLYAIDRIISRTVSYAVVTGLVAGVYLGCVALLTRALPVRGNIGIALAVLAAAAVFSPLRRRVQAAVDRRFDRARYNARRVVTQFSSQLRDQVDLDVLSADLIAVVDHVLAPEHVGLWLNRD